MDSLSENLPTQATISNIPKNGIRKDMVPLQKRKIIFLILKQKNLVMLSYTKEELIYDGLIDSFKFCPSR